MVAERETARIARARLEAAETGAGIAEERRPVTRVELEMLNALHAVAWAVLALVEVMSAERIDVEDPAELERVIRAGGLEHELIARLDRRPGEVFPGEVADR